MIGLRALCILFGMYVAIPVKWSDEKGSLFETSTNLCAYHKFPPPHDIGGQLVGTSFFVVADIARTPSSGALNLLLVCSLL